MENDSASPASSGSVKMKGVTANHQGGVGQGEPKRFTTPTPLEKHQCQSSSAIPSLERPAT